MSLIILGEIHVLGDDIQVALAAAAKHAAITRNEPGCLHFSVARDVLSSEVLRVSEWWKDDESLRAHLSRKHVNAFLATLAALRVTKTTGLQFDVSEAGDAPR
jgi:quinol monooxygenase YgiN